MPANDMPQGFENVDLRDTTDAGSAFYPEKRHARCVDCGGRMYRVRVTNPRGTYYEFRHDENGSMNCPSNRSTRAQDEGNGDD